MQINGVTANEWLKNGADWTCRCADIPNTHGLVPAAGNDKIGILLIEFTAEDSIVVTWRTRSTFEINIEGPSLFEDFLVVNSDHSVVTRSHELSSIIIVVHSQQLVELIENGIEQLAGGHMPMLKGAICVDRYDHILGHSWAFQGSPFNGHHWHLLVHICIQDE